MGVILIWGVTIIHFNHVIQRYSNLIMSSIQKTLDSLQPHVIGIRYVEGTPLIDVILKEGWTLPEDNDIQKIKGDEGLNYYMIFSDNEKKQIGIDGLLNYVDKTIKINKERERKHELFVQKVNELKEVFKHNNLSKLLNLKFSFNDDNLVPTLTDLDLNKEVIYNTESTQELNLEDDSNEVVEEQVINTYVDENKQPIELSEEEKEILEEEERGRRNIEYLKSKKQKENFKNLNHKVELPPR